jgi:hypothetical protein
MGMTIGCARCHDHKFDPIKQTDYYALAAIFKSTKTFGDTNYGAIKHWNEHVFASPDELEKLKAVDAAIAEKQNAANAVKAEAMNAIRTAARAKASDYLVAASRISTSTTLQEITEIAEPLGLHPRILHHCRRHLEFHRDDPFLVAWHEFNLARDENGIDSHYRPLFAAVEAALAKAKNENKVVTQLDDATQEATRAALYDTSGFLTVPAKPAFAFDTETLAHYNRLADEARVLESYSPDIPSAMGVSDATVLPGLPIHIRGSHRNLGQLVARNFPEVMCGVNAQPILPRTSPMAGQLESPTHCSCLCQSCLGLAFWKCPCSIHRKFRETWGHTFAFRTARLAGSLLCGVGLVDKAIASIDHDLEHLSNGGATVIGEQCRHR